MAEGGKHLRRQDKRHEWRPGRFPRPPCLAFVGTAGEEGGGAGENWQEAEDTIQVVRGTAVGQAEQGRWHWRLVDDLVRRQHIQGTRQAAIQGRVAAGTVSPFWRVCARCVIGSSFSSPASSEDMVAVDCPVLLLFVMPHKLLVLWMPRLLLLLLDTAVIVALPVVKPLLGPLERLALAS